MKKVVIVHRWDGTPRSDWYPWLEKELEKKGLEVSVPEMPATETPEIDKWVPFLSKVVNNPNTNTFFIGHSIGCQTILRYLESLSETTRIGGAIFVAGWFNLTNLPSKEEEIIAKPWSTIPIDFKNIKKMSNNFAAIFSDNDPWVPFTDKEIFKEKLGAKIIIQKGKGHFTQDENITKLPIVLKVLLNIAK